jgi:hypothetical protein
MGWRVFARCNTSPSKRSWPALISWWQCSCSTFRRQLSSVVRRQDLSGAVPAAVLPRDDLGVFHFHVPLSSQTRAIGFCSCAAMASGSCAQVVRGLRQTARNPTRTRERFNSVFLQIWGESLGSNQMSADSPATSISAAAVWFRRGRPDQRRIRTALPVREVLLLVLDARPDRSDRR